MYPLGICILSVVMAIISTRAGAMTPATPLYFVLIASAGLFQMGVVQFVIVDTMKKEKIEAGRVISSFVLFFLFALEGYFSTRAGGQYGFYWFFFQFVTIPAYWLVYLFLSN